MGSEFWFIISSNMVLNHIQSQLHQAVAFQLREINVNIKVKDCHRQSQWSNECSPENKFMKRKRTQNQTQNFNCYVFVTNSTTEVIKLETLKTNVHVTKGFKRYNV